jgi:hypothetical protein
MDEVGKTIFSSEDVITDNKEFSGHCSTEQHRPHSPDYAESQV